MRSGDHIGRVGGTAMPAGARVAVVIGLAAAIGAALVLWSERGAALLLDLAAMGARMLCL